MARKIIVLRRSALVAPKLEYQVAFWLDTHVSRRPFLANANLNSAVRGVTAPELAAIRDGSVREVVQTISVTPGFNLAQMQTLLSDTYTAMQAAWNADLTFDRYSSSWDGVSWTMVTNG
jgi:hypothetical protein